MSNLPIEPYRSIGTFIDGDASVHYIIDNKYYYACATGNSYKVYSLPDLKIKLLSPSFEEPIRHLAALNEYVFAGTNTAIFKMHFQHLVEKRLFGSPIQTIKMMGELLLVALENKTLHVIDAKTMEDVKVLILAFAPSVIFHPPGYLNKLVLADKHSMVLHNINTDQQLYSYLDDQSTFTLITQNRIALIAESPAIDIVAIGFQTGLIVGFNLKTCQRVFEFKQATQITALTFSKNQRSVPRLLSAGTSGEIYVWSLTKKMVEARVTSAFKKQVNGLEMLAFNDQELLFASSGVQNCLRILRLDEDSIERYLPLRTRQAVIHPLRKIRFYNGRFLVGISEESHGELIRFSLFNDAASQLLSTKINKGAVKIQTELQRKTDDIQDFVFSEMKINILNNHNLFTKHKNSPFPLFWDLENLSLRSVFLELQNEYRATFNARYADRMKKFRTVSALEVSNCGNFLFIGYSDGVLLKISTQSGKLMTDFVDNLSPLTEESVDSIHCDLHDHYVLVICGGKIYKFDFFKGVLMQEKSLGESKCYKTELDRNSELLMTCHSDGQVLLMDAASLQTVRAFSKITPKIIDLCFFSQDKKAIIVREDKTLSILDLFLGEVLCTYQFDEQIVSVAYEESLGFLATCFAGKRDVFLWNINNIHLKHADTITGKFVSSLRLYPSNPRTAYFGNDASVANGLGKRSNLKGDTYHELKQAISAKAIQCLKRGKLAPARVSFSEVPMSKWRGLLDIELLMAHNELGEKNFEAVEEETPFFLNFGESYLDKINQEVLDTLEPKAEKRIKRQTKDLDKNEMIDMLGDPIDKAASKIDMSAPLNSPSNKAAFDQLFTTLKELSAAEIDYMLKKTSFSDLAIVHKLLAFFCHLFQSKREFDFKQALLKHFLTVR